MCKLNKEQYFFKKLYYDFTVMIEKLNETLLKVLQKSLNKLYIGYKSIFKLLCYLTNSYTQLHSF